LHDQGRRPVDTEGGEPGVRSVAFLGDYTPRQCGIATFTHDLRTALARRYPASDCFVVAVDDGVETYAYPPEVRFDVREGRAESYLRAAEYLNSRNADVACLQHEYGIFGGPAGSHVLGLLRGLRMPLVTTLHTVLDEPDADQRRVLAEVAALSARLVVMTERSRSILLDRFGVPASKVDLIAHGIPDPPPLDPAACKAKFGVAGRLVGLTFGLISPNKGIEHMLRAMPAVLREFPSFVYLVVGATHPNLVRDQGERYRDGLVRLAAELGVAHSVVFLNRFVGLDELSESIAAADVYVTPYLNPAQSVSGTLAYSFGCGKAVVSTPYWHAQELLADGRGRLVPFADSGAIARAICGLFRDEAGWRAVRERAHLLGREMVWPHVARLYMESFVAARRPPAAHARGAATAAATTTPRPAPPEPASPPACGLPPLRLDHLLRMTDSTGIFQFADHGVPNFADGYCTDDVARALLLTVLLGELGRPTPAVEAASTTYASFLQYAYEPTRRRFRNFLPFDRRWPEGVGSDDSLGRAVWALGACAGRSRRPDLRSWATRFFVEALPTVASVRSPRTWAFGLLGIQDYLGRFEGDREIRALRDGLTARLLDIFDRTEADGWTWFEESLSYDNARLPQALLCSGEPRAEATGLRALRWLTRLQRSPAGDFRAIGSDGFHRKGGEPAQFDQQPVEAQATVSACLQAHRLTGDPGWLAEARTAFAWFLGRNDLGLELYDRDSGGCRDGLHRDRVNRNMGAESTLAFLLALTEMALAEPAAAPAV